MGDEISTEESNKGGVVARQGFTYQDSALLTSLIWGISNPEFQFAYTELHEDHLLVFTQRIEIVQVKKRDSQTNRWSLDKEFYQTVIKQFHETTKKITTPKKKEFHFITNNGLTSTLAQLFKYVEKGNEQCSPDECTYVNDAIKKIAKSLKISETDQPLIDLIWGLRYKNKESLDAAIRSNRDTLHEQLSILELTHEQIKALYDRLLALVTKAGAEISDCNLEKINEVLNDATLTDREKTQKISQIKRCISRDQVLSTLLYQDSPLAGKVRIFEAPKELLNYQKRMLLANIPQKLVEASVNEYFNIEYHRKLMRGILGNTADELLDHTKGKVLTLWATIYSITDDTKFGEKVYGQCRKEIKEGVEKKELVTPILQHEPHAQGLLHELAEENKISYKKNEN